MIKIFKKQTSSDKNQHKIKKLAKKRKRKSIKKQLVLKKVNTKCHKIRFKRQKSQKVKIEI
jgi:hypothetical protein